MKLSEFNRRVKDSVKVKTNVYFLDTRTPFFQVDIRQNRFTYRDVSLTAPTPNITIFSLGIRNGRQYHLNIVTYNTLQNTIYRFEPAGHDPQDPKNIKIRKFITNAIASFFKPSNNPHFKINLFKAQQTDSDCVICCLKHIEDRLKEI